MPERLGCEQGFVKLSYNLAFHTSGRCEEEVEASEIPERKEVY